MRKCVGLQYTLAISRKTKLHAAFFVKLRELFLLKNFKLQEWIYGIHILMECKTVLCEIIKVDSCNSTIGFS